MPLLFVVQGGAGADKSTLINAISDWSEYNLTTARDNVEQPYVLRCTSTGCAASVF